MGIFKRQVKEPQEPARESVVRRSWAGGVGALSRSTYLSDPAAHQALEAECDDGETILGVVDGTRLFLSGMNRCDGAIVLTDVRLVFVEIGQKVPTASSVSLSTIKELGARSGFFEVVLAPGPPSDHNTWWLGVGPEEHLRPFAALVMSSPHYAGDR